MRKQNRAYKRNEPHRDSSFFVIVCEGAKTEIEYFENFQQIEQQRVKVISTAPVENKSAPKWVLDKAVEVATDLNLKEYDQLWIVTDKDRWSFEELNTIQSECIKQKNWNFVVSNPCFEVWLHAHTQDLENITTTDRYELKRQFGLLKHQGLFENPLQNVRLAIERAKRLDNSPHFIPESLRTKVYLLVEELIKRIGEQYFE
jgi:RloB-like protein